MPAIQAAIRGVHGYVPETVLTNADLEKMVDTSDEWIRSRTGIHERRILRGEGKATSYMGEQIVNGLLEKTGVSASEVDMVICATITPDMVFPDTANTICDKCGLTNAFGYDIGAACSGFLFSLVTAAKFIESGTFQRVIVLGIDTMSSIIDYTDRTTCVIFGDGGGGVLLEPTTRDRGLKDAIMRGDGAGRAFLHMKAGGSLRPTTAETVANREHFVYQEGRSVFKAAVKGMTQSVEEILERNQLTKSDIAWIVPHQANQRIIGSLADMLDFPMERVMVNIHKYGNTTAGTLPLCLWEWEDRLKDGDWLILTAFGGGFTWGSALIRWGHS